jgi:fructoselysine-6-P-deglycase FrlB-like protein
MSDMPELRDGPPWAMEEMILAEPTLVAPIMASPAALEAAESIREGGPVVLVGCGTSEHAALAGAALLGHATARDAFEASLAPQDGGVCIGISHEAGTKATLNALRAAAGNGARTVLITAKPELAHADIVVGTPLVDASWCHTVGYVSPLLALTAIAGAADADTCYRVIEETLAMRDGFTAAASVIAGAQRLIVCGSGVDEITARELSLKIEEGAHVPTTPLGVEKVLHGHLPAADERTGIVVLRAHPGEARDRRAEDVLAATEVLGMPSVLLDGLPTGHPLLAGALALQLFTLELVHALGTNPDLIRREDPLYKAVADAAAAG